MVKPVMRRQFFRQRLVRNCDRLWRLTRRVVRRRSRGRKKKAELCAGCHGENGISQTENIPSLAGQPDQFIQWQLVFFRGGARKNEQMQPIAEQIDNSDIRNLGAYFASLTPPKAQCRTTIPIFRRRARRPPPDGAAPHCHTDTFARHQGGRAHRRPARGISRESAARLQVGCAIRRRRRGDGRCRLPLERRGNHRARALSRASLKARPERSGAGAASRDAEVQLRWFSYAFRCV